MFRLTSVKKLWMRQHCCLGLMAAQDVAVSLFLVVCVMETDVMVCDGTATAEATDMACSSSPAETLTDADPSL